MYLHNQNAKLNIVQTVFISLKKTQKEYKLLTSQSNYLFQQKKYVYKKKFYTHLFYIDGDTSSQNIDSSRSMTAS